MPAQIGGFVGKVKYPKQGASPKVGARVLLPHLLQIIAAPPRGPLIPFRRASLPLRFQLPLFLRIRSQQPAAGGLDLQMF